MALNPREKHRRIMLTLLIELWIIIGLAAVIFYQTAYQTPRGYGAVYRDQNNQLQMFPLTPLNSPVITRDSLLEWATLAATSAYTYDAARYQQQLNSVTNQYFTTDGGAAFLDTLQTSGVISNVVLKQLTVTAVLQNTPVILKQGMLLGRYSWKVQMPILVTYQGLSGAPTSERILVTLLIVSIPTWQSPTAIGIEQFWSATT